VTRLGECRRVWQVHATRLGECRRAWRVRATRLGKCRRVWRVTTSTRNAPKTRPRVLATFAKFALAKFAVELPLLSYIAFLLRSFLKICQREVGGHVTPLPPLCIYPHCIFNFPLLKVLSNMNVNRVQFDKYVSVRKYCFFY
jgi:hypothetical protein